MLIGVDDEMEVLIPMSAEFDGYFKHPCTSDSGVAELGVNENLGTTKDAFVLAPCAYYDANKDCTHELN